MAAARSWSSPCAALRWHRTPSAARSTVPGATLAAKLALATGAAALPVFFHGQNSRWVPGGLQHAPDPALRPPVPRGPQQRSGRRIDGQHRRRHRRRRVCARLATATPRRVPSARPPTGLANGSTTACRTRFSRSIDVASRVLCSPSGMEGEAWAFSGASSAASRLGRGLRRGRRRLLLRHGRARRLGFRGRARQ